MEERRQGCAFSRNWRPQNHPRKFSASCKQKSFHKWHKFPWTVCARSYSACDGKHEHYSCLWGSSSPLLYCRTMGTRLGGCICFCHTAGASREAWELSWWSVAIQGGSVLLKPPRWTRNISEDNVLLSNGGFRTSGLVPLLTQWPQVPLTWKLLRLLYRWGNGLREAKLLGLVRVGKWQSQDSQERFFQATLFFHNSIQLRINPQKRPQILNFLKKKSRSSK